MDYCVDHVFVALRQGRLREENVVRSDKMDTKICFLRIDNTWAMFCKNII